MSFVIPVMNEEETIIPLFEAIGSSACAENHRVEVIFIDDGSTDQSWKKMEDLSREFPGRVKAIKFRRNFGKAAALAAGFRQAQGEIVFTMDADLQDDPKEITRFISRLDEGYDLVSGWKKSRKDPLGKTLPSKLFNSVVSLISGIALHDFNCGFKAYRREVLGGIRLYGELHRFIPVLAHNMGFRISEIEVTHHPRKFGRSKYGWERLARGFLDLLSVVATTRYLQRPGHLFGGMGIFFGLTGCLILTYLSILWFMGNKIGTRPLLAFGIMFFITGVQFVSLGLLAELQVRNTPQSDNDERMIVEKVGV